MVCLAASAQQGAVRFKHFRTYPQGQWSQQAQAYRNGAPAGPAQTSTNCSSPLNAGQAAAATKLGNSAAPMCTMKVLVDEQGTAEYEQTCNLGAQAQVIHSKMNSIDDRTIATEIHMTLGGQEVSFSKITSRYLGPCRAGEAHEEIKIPSMPKLTKEECADVAAMRQQVDDSLKGCASGDMPDADRASCKAAMQRLSNEVQQREAACK